MCQEQVHKQTYRADTLSASLNVVLVTKTTRLHTNLKSTPTFNSALRLRHTKTQPAATAVMPSSGSDICLYFLSLFFPPLGVAIKRGCGADLLINIGLSLLAWIPGVIHAW